MSKTIANPYENFIALSRYARWIPEENRRETWGETVDRYFAFMLNHLKQNHNYIPDEKLVAELKDGVFQRNVMPSMRSVMTSGAALERDNVAGYNCSFVPVDSPRSFDETMYILMCGTGVGFSVEYKYVNKLPAVPDSFEKSDTVIVVEDSKQGWAKAYRELLALLWTGHIPAIDVSKVRPAGARLKTMGGRSSGPQPLINLFDFTIAKFKNAAGRQLKPIEAHDIMCKIGEVVVVGGVRRSAMISLSNINDIEMAAAKSGNWWENNTQRALSNNSVAYSRKPDMEQFIAEWKSLYDSKSGERGIYNVAAAQAQAAKYGRRDPDIHYGTNPCSEIILRPYQFCNLSEVVLRENDTKKDIERKVELATILGTWQSTLTDFKYLRKIWKDNTEEERLLGVSLTGVCDCPAIINATEKEIKERVSLVNEAYVADLYAKNKKIFAMQGHYANWEWPALAWCLLYPGKSIGIYKPLTNPFFDQYYFDFRSRFGMQPIAMNEVARTLIAKRNEAYTLGIISDQTPVDTDAAYWTTFLNQPTAVFLGTEKLAKYVRVIFYLLPMPEPIALPWRAITILVTVLQKFCGTTIKPT